MPPKRWSILKNDPPLREPLAIESYAVDLNTVDVIDFEDEGRFSPGNHEKINVRAETNLQCSRQLNYALYWQDFPHQFESKAHFDNCAFKLSINYIDSLTKLAAKDVQQGQKNMAIFKIGQALHAIQDFYAHSNYVELMEKEFDNFDDVAVLPVWTSNGQEDLTGLVEKGLVSGYVFWGFPQQCKKGVPSHSELAKDNGSADGNGGKSTNWPGWTRFAVARELASQASRQFIRFTLLKHPALLEHCGTRFGYTVLNDSRKKEKGENR